MEAELVGYARGAFSGAVHGYDGLLTAAEGGTVFLDEIDDTPLPVQVKLLRVLEDRTVSRLGESTWHQVDFRIVAATNRDLRPLIAEGRFGGDLYERLAILSLHLPPLRERTEDLPELVAHFVGRFQREHATTAGPEIHATPEVLRALARYPWPGNVRELRNVLFQSLLGKRGGAEILLSDLPARILRPQVSSGETPLLDPQVLTERLRAGASTCARRCVALERAALTGALALAGGSAAEAARILGEVGRGAARDPGGRCAP
jgi:transcriptional regulator with PAS, ATPase and Fis domain